VGDDLAEEKKLLSLVWCEVRGGLGSLPEAGGGVCGGVGAAAADTREENKNGGVDWLLPPWRKKEELSVERVKDELGVAWLGVAESTVERECRERDLLQKKLGRRLVFSDFWT
jgi:hypothetical protein